MYFSFVIMFMFICVKRLNIPRTIARDDLIS